MAKVFAERVPFLDVSLTHVSLCCERLAELALPGYFIRKARMLYLGGEFLLNRHRSSTNNIHILEETDDEFVFPAGSLIPGEDNVLTIVQVSAYLFVDSPSNHVVPQDNMGLNQTDGSESAPIFLILFSPRRKV